MPGRYLNFRAVRWTELLLLVAGLALFFELYPPAWDAVVYALDIRRWPRTAWFGINWIVLMFLVAVRFGPDWLKSMREQKLRRNVDRAKDALLKKRREEAETLRRIKAERTKRRP